MLTILEAKGDLRQTRNLFAAVIRNLNPESVHASIGFPGGTYRTQVLWLPSYGFWAHFGYPPSQKANANRYWNVFGLGKPAGTVRIICEVNSPFEGINRNIGGAFARKRKRISILHRGLFRSTGMSKAFFCKNYMGQRAEVIDGNMRRKLALVMSLDSLSTPDDLASFIREVSRIKELAREQPSSI